MKEGGQLSRKYKIPGRKHKQFRKEKQEKTKSFPQKKKKWEAKKINIALLPCTPGVLKIIPL